MSRNAPYIVPAECALTVFTDGASFQRPRRGGIGIRFVSSDRVGNEEAWNLDEPGFRGATNNQMELLAVVTALKAVQGLRFRADLLNQATKIEIYTDSNYVVSNLDRAIYEWPRAGWMTRTGAPVLNADLWAELVRELRKVRNVKRVEVKWGKGHSANNPHNKVADKLAKASASQAIRPPVAVVGVRRKKTEKPVVQGSVQMLGQRLTIRIVTAQYLTKQKVHKYTYEVMSRRSPFFGNADVSYSTDAQMRPGHTYHVTMNDDQRYPQIVKCHREIAA